MTNQEIETIFNLGSNEIDFISIFNDSCYIKFKVLKVLTFEIDKMKELNYKLVFIDFSSRALFFSSI